MNAINPALQAWTVRNLLKSNPRDTIAKIRDIGFKFIELAGTSGVYPEEFSALCRVVGLQIIGIHESPLTQTNLTSLVDEIRYRADIFNCKYATIMWEPSEPRSSTAYLRYAALCSEAGGKLRAAGINLCFHCYHHDITSLTDKPDESGLDILLKMTAPESLAIELDTYFIFKSGLSINEIAKKCLKRCRLVHLNDYSREGRQAPLGHGIISWTDTIKSIVACCSPEWFVVEQDTNDPLPSIRLSYNYLTETINSQLSG